MSSIVERVLAGEQRAVARMLRLLDDGHDGALEVLKDLYPHTGKARVIGLTGAPGSGKSTLSDKLISQWRNQGKKVGVLAIDPTSPFSGGAILGDRIRMQQHENDPGVFVRSLATRGALGGLSRSTAASIRVLDAAGYDMVLVETVGVGQDEVDIVKEADTSLVVVIPGMGDDIQAIKAGVLEIADIFVLNKCDREGADRTEKEIKLMLELNQYTEHSWKPEIIRTVAREGQGLEALISEIDRHYDHIGIQDPSRSRGRRAQQDAKQHLHALLDLIISDLETTTAAELMNDVEKLTIDPYTAAEELLEMIRKDQA